ncbi:desmoglein-2.1 isoform X3 [Fundulus heteroclitus]|uniref:desmoglein-2.1 isoform X3 n=1 Tax=Fundulus heteroclitus TaxID=8078 RepID=UPI00165CB0ED|nr:desmoglein-2.1 isoform X3 [Fundulus heteroclitus]
MLRQSWSLLVLLLFGVQVAIVVRAHSGNNLVRHKREWVLPPKPLTENVDYTQKESIAKIRSDYQTGGQTIMYSLEGRGANQYPFHVFVVDPRTGNVRVTKILDREEIDTYELKGIARYPNGTEAEKAIDLRIKVVDQNDNAPNFGSSVLKATVDECSPTGTTVMIVNATDADEENTKNSKIAYSIISQKPNAYFDMSTDGFLVVKSAMLDREKEDTYFLTVMAKDLYGEEGGLTATATVTITLNDVNDNPPTLEKSEYEGVIEENTAGVEVMRIKAQDLDERATDNWEAVYEIVKGNEAGYFSIKNDPLTNEAILMLDKAVDYEDVKNLELGLAVKNKAPLFAGSGANGGANIGFGGGAGGASGASGASGTTFKTYPIKINVKNQPEGPHFDPAVKAIPVTEGGQSFTMNQVIASYPATDKDTGKPAENVKYVKGSDPENWFTIDPKTAEIKLIKKPDRESTALVNGTYFAKILCITEDMPAKTATGTIAIQVEDYNDHCPTLTSDTKFMCTSKNSIIVSAKDEDAFPNGAPFQFIIVPEGTEGTWQVEHYNDTAAIVRTKENKWPDVYNLKLQVKDQQGKACQEPQEIKVYVCDCGDGVDCAKTMIGKDRPQPILGAAGIGLLLLGLMLLLFIPLLMFLCQCGGATKYKDLFTEVPFSTKSYLINYHTEGHGDNAEVPLMNAPPQRIIGTTQQAVEMVPGAGLEMQQSVASINLGTFQGETHWKAPLPSSGHKEGIWGMNQWEGSAFYSESNGRESRGRGFTDGMIATDSFLNSYYNKVCSRDENPGIKDGLLVYDYEGQGSPVGSLGCCSFLESDIDVQFLNDLGPRFKTLAEICGGNTLQTEITQVDTSVTSASVNNIQMSETNLETSQEMSYSSNVPPSNCRTEQTLVSKTMAQSEIRTSKAAVGEGMISGQTGIAHQNQMLVLNQQQPVYFTSTPVLQPMHYVVQQPLQSTMILAEAPAPNLQHMVVVNGTDIGASQGVIVQGQTMIPSAQTQSFGTVLVDSMGIQGTTGNLVSGAQNMSFVEGKVPAGSMKVLNGNQANLVHGGTTVNKLSESHTIRKVGESNSRGQQLQNGRGLLQKIEVSEIQQVSGGASNGTHGSASFKHT